MFRYWQKIYFVVFVLCILWGGIPVIAEDAATYLNKPVSFRMQMVLADANGSPLEYNDAKVLVQLLKKTTEKNNDPLLWETLLEGVSINAGVVEVVLDDTDDPTPNLTAKIIDMYSGNLQVKITVDGKSAYMDILEQPYAIKSRVSDVSHVSKDTERIQGVPVQLVSKMSTGDMLIFSDGAWVPTLNPLLREDPKEAMFNDYKDVQIEGVGQNDMIMFDGTHWVNVSMNVFKQEVSSVINQMDNAVFERLEVEDAAKIHLINANYIVASNNVNTQELDVRGTANAKQVVSDVYYDTVPNYFIDPSGHSVVGTIEGAGVNVNGGVTSNTLYVNNGAVVNIDNGNSYVKMGGDPPNRLEVGGTGAQYIKLNSTDSNVGVRYHANGIGWVTGIDNADAGKYKIGYGDSLGGAEVLVIDTAQNIGVGKAPMSNTKLAIGGNVNVSGDVYAKGDMEADYFIGDGSQLSNVPAAWIAWENVLTPNIDNDDINVNAGIAITKIKRLDTNKVIMGRDGENKQVLLRALAEKAVIEAGDISAGTIVNNDISPTAEIAFTKLNITAQDIRGIGAYSAGMGVVLSSAGVFSIGQEVKTTSDVTFKNVDVSEVVTAGTVTANILSGDGANVRNISLVHLPQITSDYIKDATIGAIDIATDAVTVDELANNAVDTDAIINRHVTGIKIAQNTITSQNIKTGAVGTDEIEDGSIESGDIGLNTITSDNIATDGVGADEIAANAVDSEEIKTGAVGTDEIENGAVGDVDIDQSNPITFGKLDISSQNIRGLDTYIGGTGVTVAQGTGVVSIGQAVDQTSDVAFRNINVSGVVTANSVSADFLYGNGQYITDLSIDAIIGITHAQIADNTIISKNIATDGVDYDEIATDAVRRDEIASDAVGSDEIVNNSIADADISSSAAITFSKLDISSKNIRDIEPYISGTGVSVNVDTGVVSIGQAVGSNDSVVFNEVKASKFLDVNDSAYYLKPSTTSKIKDLSVVTIDASGTISGEIHWNNITNLPPGLNVSSEKYKAGKGMYFDGNRYEFSIGQSVSTDASVVFGNVDVPNGTVTANAIKVGGITATSIITAPEFVGDVKWENITDTESSNVTFNYVYADKFYDSSDSSNTYLINPYGRSVVNHMNIRGDLTVPNFELAKMKIISDNVATLEIDGGSKAEIRLKGDDNTATLGTYANSGVGPDSSEWFWGIEKTSSDDSFMLNRKDNNSDETALVIVNKDGDMGVGEDNPKSILHLSKSSGSASGPTIILDRKSGNEANQNQSVQFKYVDQNSGFTSGFVHQKGTDLRLGTTFSDGSIKFYTNNGSGYNAQVNGDMFGSTDGTSDSPKMVINEFGNVGIGDIVPGVKLSINGDAQVSGDVTATGGLVVGGTVTANFFVGDGSNITDINADNLSGITTVQIKDETILSEDIATGAVTAIDIASNAVDSAEISANAVTRAKIAEGAVSSREIATNAVDTAEISANAVTNDEIDNTQSFVFSGVSVNGVVNALEFIGDGSKITDINADNLSGITTVQIKNETILSEDIATGAVTAIDIAANAVDTVEISANAVTREKIADNAVTNDEIDNTESFVIANVDVAGTVTANVFIGDGSQLSGIDMGLWATSNTDINYMDGKVGIGTTAPTAKFRVYGDFMADELASGIKFIPSSYLEESSSYATTKFIANEPISASEYIDKLNEKTGLGASTDDHAHFQVTGGDNKQRSIIITTGDQIRNIQGWNTQQDNLAHISLQAMGGNVGIGTTAPTEKLHVAGNIKATGGLDVAGTVKANKIVGAMDLDDTGTNISNIGVSNLSPGVLVTDLINNNSTNDETLASVKAIQRYVDNQTYDGYLNSFKQNDNQYIKTEKIIARDSSGLALFEVNGGGIFVEDGGSVGIGTTAPTEKLHVVGTIKVESYGEYLEIRPGQRQGVPNANYTTLEMPGSNNTLYIWDGLEVDQNLKVNKDIVAIGGVDVAGTVTANKFVKSDGTDVGLWGKNGIDAYYIDGKVGIGTIAPSEKLHVDGNIKATGHLELVAGSDLAELFDVLSDKPVEPGTVVSISTQHLGKLHVSNIKHDPHVVGVVSGAKGIDPGIILHQKGTIADGEVPVAIAGRVWVKCNTENGPIAPGDALTTATQPGFAMKAGDSQPAGSLFAKAMSRCQDDGMVFALIGQQSSDTQKVKALEDENRNLKQALDQLMQRVERLEAR